MQSRGRAQIKPDFRGADNTIKLFSKGWQIHTPVTPPQFSGMATMLYPAQFSAKRMWKAGDPGDPEPSPSVVDFTGAESNSRSLWTPCFT